jgi:hypothetical protein
MLCSLQCQVYIRKNDLRNIFLDRIMLTQNANVFVAKIFLVSETCICCKQLYKVKLYNVIVQVLLPMHGVMLFQGDVIYPLDVRDPPVCLMLDVRYCERGNLLHCRTENIQHVDV